MAKKTYDLYEELANLQNDHDIDFDSGLIPYSGKGRFDEDDSESFMCGTEIKKLEKEAGIKPTVGPKQPMNIDETVHFKRYTKKRVHKYTETEMKQIRDECREVIVHDYGDNDWYHVSDEEREHKDQLNEIAEQLAGIRGTYSKVDQYINAMRIVYHAWTIIAKSNYLHTREEFFKMVAKGEIMSPRIPDVKLRKMDKYNMDLLVHYISNPDIDASHLVPEEIKEDDDEWRWNPNAESEIERMMRILSPEEVSHILESYEDEQVQPMLVKNIKRKYIKGYDKRNLSTKRKKKGSKSERYMKENLSIMLRKIQNHAFYKENQGHSWMITNSLFDQRKEEPSIYSDIPFTGSWSDEESVALYDLMISEAMMDEIPPWEKHKTYGELELQKFYKTLEEHGLNVTELRKRMGQSGEQIDKKEILRERKVNKKKENTIIQRLTGLNNNDKFKKLIQKAEKAANNQDGDD